MVEKKIDAFNLMVHFVYVHGFAVMFSFFPFMFLQARMSKNCHWRKEIQ